MIQHTNKMEEWRQPAEPLKTLLWRSVGERRKLKVPYMMGYRDLGHPGFGIPGAHAAAIVWLPHGALQDACVLASLPGVIPDEACARTWRAANNEIMR